MQVEQPARLQVAVPFGDGFEKKVTAEFKKFAREAGIDEITYRALHIALMEIALNAYEHSATPDKRVFLIFENISDRIVIKVIDRGHGKANPWNPPSPYRGHGLKMVRAVVDELDVLDRNPGLAVTIAKKIRRLR